MRHKGAWLFWTDVLNGLLFVALMTTGAILRWVLPPGSGGGGREEMGRGFRGGRGPAATLLDWSRHEWGDFHFWIAVALGVGVLIHLLLHVGWIKTASIRYLFPFRAARRHTTPSRPLETPGGK